MNHQFIAPPEMLSPLIRHFWILDGNNSTGEAMTFGAIPDGCPGMIIQRPESESGLFDNNGKALPEICVYGQTTTPVNFTAKGKLKAIGIYFQPHALRSIFGIDADEITDSCLDLISWDKSKGKRLYEHISRISTFGEALGPLSNYFLGLQQTNKRLPDPATNHAISRLLVSEGSVSMRELQQEVRLSERSLERKFKETVGISPKLFSRIIRFQESLDQFRRNDYSKLSDIAYDNNYTDQSHFIRVFKEFTGYSPFEYRRNVSEAVKNFPQISPAIEVAV